MHPDTAAVPRMRVLAVAWQHGEALRTVLARHDAAKLGRL